MRLAQQRDPAGCDYCLEQWTDTQIVSSSLLAIVCACCRASASCTLVLPIVVSDLSIVELTDAASMCPLVQPGHVAVVSMHEHPVPCSHISHVLNGDSMMRRERAVLAVMTRLHSHSGLIFIQHIRQMVSQMENFIMRCRQSR